MHTDKAKVRPLLYAIAIYGLASSNTLAQHVHGVVELGVVLEGNTVAVSLSAPLSDVVGFEHEPKNEEQVAQIQQAASVLSDADAMFGLAEAAQCEVADTIIDGPAWVEKHLADESIGTAGHDDEHHGEHHDEHHDEHDDAHDSHGSESAHEEHADSGDHDHDHDHDHDDSVQHSEVNASYEWVCGDVEELDSLALRFTSNFASVETIEIQILTSSGARVLTEKGRAASVSLSPP